MECEQLSSPSDEFASLSEARAYVDTVRKRMGSLGAHELIDVLDRLDRAYENFPELLPERPRPSLASIVTASLEYDGDTLVRLLGRFRGIRWEAIEPIVGALRGQGRMDAVLQIVSTVLDHVTFGSKASAAAFSDVLAELLADDRRLNIERSELARSARRRMKEPAPGRHRLGSKKAALALAERLRVDPSPAPATQPGRAWSSGRLSFAEFLLQWPCEIELPVELDDPVFIDEAYRAILLREPKVIEREQYLRLLRDGAASREWVIEDLLASAELHSLERRLRVVCGDRVITEPGVDMPAVTWPPHSTG
jgi:hypothetical protein